MIRDVLDISLKLKFGKFLFMDPDEYFYKNLAGWCSNFKRKYEEIYPVRTLESITFGRQFESDRMVFRLSPTRGVHYEFSQEYRWFATKSQGHWRGLDERSIVEGTTVLRQGENLQKLIRETGERRKIFQKYMTPNGGTR